MTKPKVAVILPVYNCLEYLKDMLDALYDSTDFPFKLIIIDGYSDDGTYEFVTHYLMHESVEFYQIPKKGLVNAINFGIQKAGTLDVYCTQADVIHYKMYRKDWLECMYNMSKDKKIGMITGLGGWGTSGPECINGFRWIGTWNTYIPRRVINKVGLFDEQFFGMDDIDYSYRVNKEGFINMIIDYWVHHHQLTERNNTHSSNNLSEMAKLFRKKHKLGEFEDEINK